MRDEARTGSESKQTLIHGLGALRRSISCPASSLFSRHLISLGDFLKGGTGKEGGTQFSEERTFMRPVYECSDGSFPGKNRA